MTENIYFPWVKDGEKLELTETFMERWFTLSFKRRGTQ